MNASPRPLRIVKLVGTLAIAAAVTSPAVAEPPTPALPSGNIQAKPSPAWQPTDTYTVKDVRGWRVIVSRALIEEKTELCDEALELLDYKLYDVGRAVPAEAVAKLQKVPIWIEAVKTRPACMEYHPSAGWLRAHGINPDKAKCVEISDAERFVNFRGDQPWVVLHELAHGYHHQFLADGFGNGELKAAHAQARESGTYDSVLHAGNRKVRHYALKDPMEYFAELSEAYFGTNDYHPFVRAELKHHDPDGYKLIEKLWGVK